MTDKWFDEYMFRVVAEKKYVPAKVLDILKQKPIRLPMMHCATMLFLGMVDDATTFAETRGGGGGGSDLKWGRDEDEDNRASVSYTHLDVYKRQQWRHSVC